MRFCNPRGDKNGFTLLELIIAMFVSLIFIGLAFSFLRYNTALYAKAHNEGEIQRDCTAILEILTIAAKESCYVGTPVDRNANPNVYIFYSKYEEDDGGNIVFTDASTSEIKTVVKGTVAFNGDNGTLEIIDLELGEPPQEVSNTYQNIDDFSITDDDGTPLREITITGRQRRDVLTFTTTASLRNRHEAIIP